MSNFNDLWSELMLNIPAMPDTLAQRCINRAWRDVKEAHFWSFLMASGFLFAPGLISTGNVTVTTGLMTVTCDATATAALTGLTNPPINKRQFRIVGGATTYNIVSLVGSTLTLELPFMEGVSSTKFQVYRCVYGYPLGSAGVEVTDFLRYSSIRDLLNARPFTNLRATRQEIDEQDPQRSSQSPPIWMASYDADPVTQTARFEMWPHPINQLAFMCSYQRRGTDMTVATNDALPDPIPDHLVIWRAMEYGCMLWAAPNASRLPELKGRNWDDMAASYFKRYSTVLADQRRQDEETFQQNIVRDQMQISPWPVDSAWVQSHDIYD